MNLAKALKLKNRYAQKIAQLQQDIQKNNSVIVDSEKKRKININNLMTQLEKTVDTLIKLKIIIFEASAPKRETILLLSETKSRISFLKAIDTHEGKGKQKEYGFMSNEDISYDVVFDIVWIRAEVEKCEEQVDKLQEELDVFNHKTEVEIEI